MSIVITPQRATFAAMAAALATLLLIACSNAKTTDTPSPARTFIAYNDGGGNLFTIRPDGTDRKQIFVGKAGSTGVSDVSRDGRLLALSTEGGVSIINADGSGARRVTDSGRRAVFSPTGDRLAYTESGAAYVVATVGGKPRLVYRPPAFIPGAEERGGPGSAWVVAISPDGTKLLVSEFGIVVEVGIDGSNRRVVLSDQFYNSPTGYSPDGSEILFTSNRRGHDYQESFAINADGSDIRPLVPGRSAGARYSPDGKHIVYTAWAEFDGRQLPRIFVMNADGTQSRPLTSESESAEGPIWGGTG